MGRTPPVLSTIANAKTENKQISPKEKCRLNVRFMPSGAHSTRHARLVIHHKTPPGTTFVRLQANADPPPSPLTIDSISATPGSSQCLVYVVANVSPPGGHNVHIAGNARYTAGNQSVDTPLTLSPYTTEGPSAYRSNRQITLSGKPDTLRVGLTATNGIGQKATPTSTIQLNNPC